MAKNEKSKLAALLAQAALLKAQMEQLEKETTEARKAEFDKISTLVDGLPDAFGIEIDKAKPNAALQQVADFIKARIKGTLGSLDGPRTYKRLTEEEKTAIVAELKKGTQISVLSNRFGVSDPTVFNLKKEAGLTTPRVVKVATVATPPPAPPVAATGAKK
jgi:hypothetical protein